MSEDTENTQDEMSEQIPHGGQGEQQSSAFANLEEARQAYLSIAEELNATREALHSANEEAKKRRLELKSLREEHQSLLERYRRERAHTLVTSAARSLKVRTEAVADLGRILDLDTFDVDAEDVETQIFDAVKRAVEARPYLLEPQGKTLPPTDGDKGTDGGEDQAARQAELRRRYGI